MRCRWCAEAEVSEPGLCESCQAEEDAVEFNEAHEEQCGCGGEHVLTMALPEVSPARRAREGRGEGPG